MKDKPQNWGIKIFTRAGTSNIVYDFEFYSGIGANIRSNLGFGAEMVLHLVEHFSKNLKFNIFFDSFYSSFHLVENLQQMGIESVGTLRIERMRKAKLPLWKQTKKWKRREGGRLIGESSNILALS